jgi:protein-disulfide isomerase
MVSKQPKNRSGRSTPTLFVNGQLIKNGSDYQALQTAIEAALKGE